MFAKPFTRNSSKGWAVLQWLDVEAHKILSGSRRKNKIEQTTKCSPFHHHSKFLIKKWDSPRQLHTSVKSMGLEITYAHNFLRNSEAYAGCLAHSLETKEDVQVGTVQQLIDKPWSDANSKGLLDNFELLSYYAYRNNESMSDHKYKRFLEVLMYKCKEFDNRELLHLMSCLELWPLQQNKLCPESLNLAEVIDSELLERLPNLTTDEIFLINDHFYKVNFLKKSKFTIKSLQSLNFHKLNSSHFVQLMFFFKVHGSINVSLKVIEPLLWKHFDKYSLEELGIIAMAFFKHETKLQDKRSLLKIMQKLQNNLGTVDNVTLSAILKILRYSVHLDMMEPFHNFLQSLVSQVPHRSLEVITHIALVQGSTLIHAKEVILKILERYEKEIVKARLKDIERITFVLYLFSYDPKTTPFYSAAIKDVLNPRRAQEIEAHPKSLVYTIMYMLQMNFYSEGALDYIMNSRFIDKVSQGHINNLNREYLIIDYCIELDHPEYKGPRVRKDLLEVLKRYGVFHKQSMDGKVDQFDKLMIDIIHSCKDFVRSESAVYTEFLLPHVAKNYIVLCWNPIKRKYESPAKQLSKIPLGSIKYAPKDGNKWYAIVIGSHNTLTRNTASPTGNIRMQMRHLERIGYRPILINFYKWHTFRNRTSKLNFFSSILPT